MAARDEILTRLRTALAGSAPAAPVPRGYRRDDAPATDLVDLFVERVDDYRAEVTRCTAAELADTLAAALSGVGSVAVPADVPADWLAGYQGRVLTDAADRPLSVDDLDGAGAVLTGCAVAVAETGTIVLDAGPAQGRRALTLVPDHHVCVVRVDQLAAGVPAALARLSDPTRPLTFISGPSATSDIELDRVEGVHGPRRLHVIVVTESRTPTA